MIYNELKQHGTEDFPFELYRVDSEHPKYEMAFHWHSALELIWVLEGELFLTLDNRTLRLCADEIAVVNGETVHGATPKNCRYQCLVFNLAFLKTGNADCDAFIDGILSHDYLLREHPTDGEIVSIVQKIFKTLDSESVGSAFQTMGLFQQWLGEIQKKNDFTARLSPDSLPDEKKTLKLKAALRYIRENFNENITLDDVAAIAGLSCKYFCKFFKDLTGTTPINYLMTYRIERAARKLLSSDASVTQIAYDCGFNDLSYFIKTFKAHKGVSPKEYRQR